jgi:hypothetical protein
VDYWGRESGGRAALASVLLFLNLLPFLKDQVREPRLLFHIAPFVSLAVASGMAMVFSALRGRFSRRETR